MVYDMPEFLNAIVGRIAAQAENIYYRDCLEQCQAELRSRCKIVATSQALRWKLLLVDVDGHPFGRAFSSRTKEKR